MKGDKALKKLVFYIGLAGIAFSGWYIYSLYSHMNKTMEEIYTPIERTEVRAENIENNIQINKPKIVENEKNAVNMEKLHIVKINKQKKDEKLKPISLLILGIDGNSHKGNRSDAIIVMTFNPDNNKKTILSIPRDVRVTIVGKGKQDKINHAYAFGGPQMAIDTVEEFLRIPIDYFVSIDMNGFVDTVNLLGGIKVNNEFAFTEKGIYLPKGEQILNGRKALAFARMRKNDPQGDLGRNKRQQKIIQSMMEKGIRISSIPKVKEFLGVVRTNTKTNITLDEIKMLQQYYQLSKNKEVLALKGNGEMIDNTWYLVVSDNERNKISAKLKEQLRE